MGSSSRYVWTGAPPPSFDPQVKVVKVLLQGRARAGRQLVAVRVVAVGHRGGTGHAWMVTMRSSGVTGSPPPQQRAGDTKGMLRRVTGKQGTCVHRGNNKELACGSSQRSEARRAVVHVLAPRSRPVRRRPGCGMGASCISLGTGYFAAGPVLSDRMEGAAVTATMIVLCVV